MLIDANIPLESAVLVCGDDLAISIVARAAETLAKGRSLTVNAGLTREQGALATYRPRLRVGVRDIDGLFAIDEANGLNIKVLAAWSGCHGDGEEEANDGGFERE